MNHNRYRFLLLLISAVIAITLAIQLYSVFNTYEESKRQLQRDIKTSFDLTVADYFTAREKENSFSFSKTGFQDIDDIKFDSLMGLVVDKTKSHDKNSSKKQENSGVFLKKNSTKKERFSETKSKKPFNINSITISSDSNLVANPKERKSERFFLQKDSVRTDSFELVNYVQPTADVPIRKLSKSKIKSISFSISSNIIDIIQLDSMMTQSLIANGIRINHGLKYNDGEDLFEEGPLNGDQIIKSNSPKLYNETSLELIYSGGGSTLFKRNLTSFLLSLLLITGVIFCLFYLLQVIRKQKELSLIKNDLISNITHEFKTPIATASAALEGVQNFTTSGDHEKSNRYLDVGREQLSKLNMMVEKLLETATIDSEKLALQRTRFDLTDLIQESVDRYQSTTDKTITQNLPESSVDFYGDEFHLENAVNNLLDNAIKYGGSIISVSTAIKNKEVVISISDNGKQLKAKDTKHLFDKFYRVPQGDTHNIKGYGIGLFYTKAIIEKHGGTISLSLNPTTFKIHLPYE
jgi:two-component system phosphate regulon sensor histidine kinase PhoR